MKKLEDFTLKELRLICGRHWCGSGCADKCPAGVYKADGSRTCILQYYLCNLKNELVDPIGWTFSNVAMKEYEEEK